MGKGGGSAPPPTPPGDTAKADYGADVASAGFAMEHGTPNQFMPGGSVTYSKYDLPDQELGNGKTVPGGQGVTNVFTQFSPEFQGIFDRLSQSGSSLAGQLPQSPFNSDTEGNALRSYYGQFLPQGGFNPQLDAAGLRRSIGANLPTAFNPNIDAEPLRQSYINEGLRNVQSTWDREDNQFKTLMAERGIPIGSEIFNEQAGNIQSGRNKFVENLTDQAHAAAAADQNLQFERAVTAHQLPWQNFNQAGQEESREFQQALAQRNAPWQDFTGAAAEESRQFQQGLAEYLLPWTNFQNYYNAVQGMLAGLQGRDSPLVSASPPNVDVAGITQRYDDARMRNWQIQQQNSAAGLGGLISAGAGLLGLFSDERLKTDIEKVGETDEEHGGHNVYAYHYVTDPPGTPKRMGLLAQEVEEDRPEAVNRYPGTDLRVVDYEAATLSKHLRNRGKYKEAA